MMKDTDPLGATSAGTSSDKPSEQIELRIGGMTCPHCPPAIEKALAAVPGVTSAHVNLASNTARIRYERCAHETCRRRAGDQVHRLRARHGHAPHPDQEHALQLLQYSH